MNSVRYETFVAIVNDFHGGDSPWLDAKAQTNL